MAAYTEKVRDHFISPKNLGAMESPDGVGEVGNAICGDTVKMFVRLADGKVADAKYQTYGCVFSIACADMVAELAKGATLEQAKAISGGDVARELGGLPETKAHCAVMAVNALREALRGAGQQLELLDGGKALTADLRRVMKVPLSVQVKHRVAEMFDEFIIPELESNGVSVELVDVDADAHVATFRSSSSAEFVKAFGEKLLRKYIDAGISLQALA